MASKKNGFLSSLSEIKKEVIERSVWPTRSEALSQTIVVIILLIIVSFVLGGIDYAITFLTRVLLQGDIIKAVVSSKITLFILLAFVLLFVVYFAIRYVRKNRYSR